MCKIIACFVACQSIKQWLFSLFFFKETYMKNTTSASKEVPEQKVYSRVVGCNRNNRISEWVTVNLLSLWMNSTPTWVSPRKFGDESTFCVCVSHRSKEGEFKSLASSQWHVWTNHTLRWQNACIRQAEECFFVVFWMFPWSCLCQWWTASLAGLQHVVAAGRASPQVL